jgi:hypothetical protein
MDMSPSITDVRAEPSPKLKLENEQMVLYMPPEKKGYVLGRVGTPSPELDTQNRRNRWIEECFPLEYAPGVQVSVCRTRGIGYWHLNIWNPFDTGPLFQSRIPRTVHLQLSFIDGRKLTISYGYIQGRVGYKKVSVARSSLAATPDTDDLKRAE